jgi:4-hydroxybenzoate polyprenyltransferase
MNYLMRELPLKTALMAALSAIISFRISNWSNIAFLVAIFGIMATFSTLVYDDWRDRLLDAARGKATPTFAIFFGFFALAMMMVGVFVFAASLDQTTKTSFGLLSLAIIFAGLFYQAARRIPLMPISIVAITAASGTLYPILISPTRQSWLLFAAAVLLIASRETIKDIGDYTTDMGMDERYQKWTLPVAIGIKCSKIIAILFILISLIIMAEISFVILVSIPLFLLSTFRLIANKESESIKSTFDLGSMTGLIMLLIFGA